MSNILTTVCIIFVTGGLKTVEKFYGRTGMPRLLLFLLTLLVAQEGVSQQAATTAEYSVTRIYIDQVPSVIKSRLIYSIDIYFNKRPQHFWVYTQKKDSLIVVDFYDIHLKNLADTIKTTPLFRKFEFKNMTTNMSLSGKQSQIEIQSASNWSAHSEPLEDHAIRLLVWKRIQHEEKERSIFGIILATIVSASAVGIITYFAIQNVAE